MRDSKCCVLAHSVSFDLSTEQKKVVKGKLIRAEIDNSNGRREGTGEKDQKSKMIFFHLCCQEKSLKTKCCLAD